MATKPKIAKPQPKPQLQPQQSKTTDERAMEFKASILDHLDAIARTMNDAATHGIEISFNVTRTEKGEYEPTNVGLIRRY